MWYFTAETPMGINEDDIILALIGLRSNGGLGVALHVSPVHKHQTAADIAVLTPFPSEVPNIVGLVTPF